MEALFESIRVEEYGNAVLVYNSELHAKRIFNSSRELGFNSAEPSSFDYKPNKDSEQKGIGDLSLLKNWTLFFQNQIKNYLQYKFHKIVSFKENTIADPFKDAPTHQAYKLRFIYLVNGVIELNHEKYDRDLSREWNVKIIDPEEFHINTEEESWRHKLFNRQNIPVSAGWQEQIWLNEKGEVCEGTFTNIFWQDKDGNWYTPSLKTNILPGTMRELLIPALNAQEVEYTVFDLKNASKIYLSNAMIGLKEINNLTIKDAMV